MVNSQGLALNALHVIILFLAWVGTCVSFGGVLFTGRINSAAIDGGAVSFHAYYDHVTGDGSSVSWSDAPAQLSGNDCASGGRGFVAMQVFAFLALLAALIIVILRLLGRSSLIPAFQTPAAALRGEVILTSIATFFYFLAVCIWGGTCFSKVGSQSGVSVTATGYAFVIVDFFFLMLDLVLLWVIIRNAAFQLGADAEPKHEQHTDQPQINAHPNEQYLAQQQNQQTHGDPNLVELTCPSCAAKVTCPRGGQTNCAVCDAEISA